ncbi:hypothetical protein NLI96_g9210 [Meripilus lineatus]|uniref:TPR-like protein n=1 Tax=Meripilus lineatus TaxID=2056292 RepID=A0AAD5UVU9_9APHY|nr:hypothetical protein NLI96_g9210 [Physisporinus lineatus]
MYHSFEARHADPRQRAGPRIPYDVQILVVQSLSSEETWPDARSLARCAATCSDWHYLALPGLYKRVEIIGREKYQILERTLRMDERADIVRGTRTLGLHDVTREECISPAALHTLPRFLNHLEELFIFGPYGDQNAVFPIHSTLFMTLSHFLSVRYLHLQQIQFRSLDVLRRVVGAFPTVEIVVLRSVSWKTSENVEFKPLHNATSWKSSQFSLRECTSDFVAPLFWASAPQNASAFSRRRSIERSDGSHPSIPQDDVYPICELAKFILDPPKKMVGPVCWEWKHTDDSGIWHLECCIDERTSSDTPTCIRFHFSQQTAKRSMGSQHIARVISIEISKDDQSGLDYECLNSLVDDFGFVHQLYFQFEQTDLNAPLEIPAPQIASLLKADRLVYLNGSLYESDNPYPDTATSSRLLLDAKRQKEGICIETRRQIAFRRTMVSHTLIGLSIHPCIRGDNGRHLEVMQEQVRIYRELENVGYGESRPTEMLSEHTVIETHDMCKVGQQGETVKDEKGAIPLHGKENLRIHRVRLARALNYAAFDLSNLERNEEAFEYDMESVNISRTLVEEDPLEFTGLLSDALHGVAYDLHNLKRLKEVFEYRKEEVGIRRGLAQENPSEHLPGLAISLDHTAHVLFNLGRLDDAFEYRKEAVVIRRGLAQENPSEHLPGLAISLNCTARVLLDLGRLEEAFEYDKGLVETNRGLAKENSSQHLPDLALSLDYTARVLFDLGRLEDAFGYYEEWVEVLRRLPEENPSEHLSRFAVSLDCTAQCLADLGRYEEAFGYGKEAVLTLRSLAIVDPSTSPVSLSNALHKTSYYLWKCGCYEEALEYAKDAVEIRRKLAKEGSRTFCPDLAESLLNTGCDLFKLGRYNRALECEREAVYIARNLAQQEPDQYIPLLIATLSNTAIILRALGRYQNALEREKEVEDLKSASATKEVDTSGGDIPSSVSDPVLNPERLEGVAVVEAGWSEGVCPLVDIPIQA